MSGKQIKTAPDLGYALRAERVNQGLTQADLADRADVSVRWLSNFERGKAPRAELIKVMHVARALGMAFELAPEKVAAKIPWQQPTFDFSKFQPTFSRIGEKAASQMLESVEKLSIDSLSRIRGNLIPKLNPNGLPTFTPEILKSLPTGLTAEMRERSNSPDVEASEAEGDLGKA